jgi:hypothetical protein
MSLVTMLGVFIFGAMAILAIATPVLDTRDLQMRRNSPIYRAVKRVVFYSWVSGVLFLGCLIALMEIV